MLTHGRTNELIRYLDEQRIEPHAPESTFG
jgi:hypothetical protein